MKSISPTWPQLAARLSLQNIGRPFVQAALARARRRKSEQLQRLADEIKRAGDDDKIMAGRIFSRTGFLQCFTQRIANKNFRRRICGSTNFRQLLRIGRMFACNWNEENLYSERRKNFT